MMATRVLKGREFNSAKELMLAGIDVQSHIFIEGGLGNIKVGFLIATGEIKSGEGTNITVAGNIKSGFGICIEGCLEVNGDCISQGEITTAEDLYAKRNLVGSSLAVGGYFNCNGLINIDNNITVCKNINSTQSISCIHFRVGHDALIEGSLKATGTVTIGKNIRCLGAIEAVYFFVGNDAQINKGVEVSNTVEIKNNFTVNGPITVDVKIIVGGDFKRRFGANCLDIQCAGTISKYNQENP